MLPELSFLVLSDWFLTLSLVFGGCCSNAIALEQLTKIYPFSGSLITFFQFLVISLQGLPRHVTFTNKYFIPLPCLKPRQIPLRYYLVQVVIHYAVSMLNNWAFSYKIPMPVHIIFRSGGLVINLVMGRLILGRSYTLSQVLSVFMVTIGVILTTISATSTLPAHDSSVQQYTTGVAVLTVALIFSGLLGMVQDHAYSKFRSEAGSPWQESMFYIHFLSLPMFFSVLNNITAQLKVLHASPAFTIFPQMPVTVSRAYLILAINVLTQVFCSAGVNRLTSRVSSLTVTLVLVVRKAVSLILSIALFGDAGMDEKQKLQLWGGAILVFAGTVVYSAPRRKVKEKKE